MLIRKEHADANPDAAAAATPGLADDLLIGMFARRPDGSPRVARARLRGGLGGDPHVRLSAATRRRRRSLALGGLGRRNPRVPVKPCAVGADLSLRVGGGADGFRGAILRISQQQKHIWASRLAGWQGAQ